MHRPGERGAGGQQKDQPTNESRGAASGRARGRGWQKFNPRRSLGLHRPGIEPGANGACKSRQSLDENRPRDWQPLILPLNQRCGCCEKFNGFSNTAEFPHAELIEYTFAERMRVFCDLDAVFSVSLLGGWNALRWSLTRTFNDGVQPAVSRGFCAGVAVPCTRVCSEDKGNSHNLGIVERKARTAKWLSRHFFRKTECPGCRGCVMVFELDRRAQLAVCEFNRWHAISRNSKRLCLGRELPVGRRLRGFRMREPRAFLVSINLDHTQVGACIML